MNVSANVNSKKWRRSEVQPAVSPSSPEPKMLDPLSDLLGITVGVNMSSATNSTPSTQHAAVYTGTPIGMMQSTALEHTADDRVANVKSIISQEQH